MILWRFESLKKLEDLYEKKELDGKACHPPHPPSLSGLTFSLLMTREPENSVEVENLWYLYIAHQCKTFTLVSTYDVRGAKFLLVPILLLLIALLNPLTCFLTFFE